MVTATLRWAVTLEFVGEGCFASVPVAAPRVILLQFFRNTGSVDQRASMRWPSPFATAAQARQAARCFNRTHDLSPGNRYDDEIRLSLVN
jgi:hypothetical protein